MPSIERLSYAQELESDKNTSAFLFSRTCRLARVIFLLSTVLAAACTSSETSSPPSSIEIGDSIIPQATRTPSPAYQGFREQFPRWRQAWTTGQDSSQIVEEMDAYFFMEGITPEEQAEIESQIANFQRRTSSD